MAKMLDSLEIEDVELEEDEEELEDELEEYQMRADHIPGAKQGEWTYTTYAAIPNDGKRYEVIEGVLYLMASPNVKHQSVTQRILFYMMTHFEFKGLGRVFISPIDVELAPKYVVQPDLVVILNKNKKIIQRKKLKGSPDLLVEVASPSTGGYDRTTKRTAYAKYGIKEFWLVNPKDETVEVLVLEKGNYVSKGTFAGKDGVTSTIVPEFPVRVEQFFG
jgi:Uma2 family endonuclease